MPNQRVPQVNFTNGQIDDKMIGRIELDKFRKSVSIAKNVQAIPQGGLAKRPGTEFIASLSEGNKKLINFEFNVTQTYLLILEPGKLFIYRNGILQTDINGSGNNYLVVPYTTGQIDNVDVLQSADTLFLLHEDVAPMTVTRGSAHNLWTLATFAAAPTYDFANINYNSFTFTITNSGDFGTQTLTSSADIFTPEHVGGAFRTSEGYARITARTNATTVTIDVIKDLDTSTTTGTASFSGASVRVEEPAFTAAHGYPKTATFHEGRLWFAGHKELVQTIWASVTRDFTNFEVGESLDDESIQLTLDTDQLNAITHIVSGQHLQIFTQGGEFYIRTTSGGPITPSDFSAKTVDRHGAKAGVKPIRLETQTLFVDYSGRHIRSFIYELTRDNYASDQMSLLASDLIDNPVDMTSLTNFGGQEGNYVIVVNTNGKIALMNLMPTENILSWTSIEMADGINITHCREVEGEIYLVLTGVKAGEDTLVKFTLGRFTDASITFENSTTTVTGLTHLEGQTVRVVADGAVLTDRVVSGGSITVEYPADILEVGLGYDLRIKTLPISPPDALGAETVEMKRINYIEVMMTPDSLGVFIEGYRLSDRTLGNSVLGSAPMNDSIYRGTTVLGYSRIRQIEITQTDPLSFTLLTLTCQVSI